MRANMRLLLLGLGLSARLLTTVFLLALLTGAGLYFFLFLMFQVAGRTVNCQWSKERKESWHQIYWLKEGQNVKWIIGVNLVALARALTLGEVTYA